MPTESLADEIKGRSAWSILMGVLTALLGLFLIAYPMAAATVTTLLLGWILIFVAIAQIVFAFHSHTTGGFFSKILLAVFYGIAGIGLALFPVAGVAALTMMLGTLLLVCAGVEAAMAFEMRPVEGWGVVSFRCRRYVPRSHADSREVAIQFLMGDRYSGWRGGSDGRNLQNHDRLANTKQHRP